MKKYAFILLLLMIIPLVMAQDTKNTDIVGWVFNSVKSVWEYWFGGQVTEISIINPNLKLGTIKQSTTSSNWKVIYTSDKDFFSWIQDSNSKNTYYCLLNPSIKNPGGLPAHLNVYDSSKSLITSLNVQQLSKTVSGLSQNYYGYCRNLDSNTLSKLKLGDNSTWLIFGDNIQFSYEPDWANLTIYIEKEINETWVSLDNATFIETNNTIKLKANDPYCESGYCKYRWRVESNTEIKSNGFNPYISRVTNSWLELFNNYNTEERHSFDFSQDCERNISGGANCQFLFSSNIISYLNSSEGQIPVYNYQMINEFYSDGIIDPVISVSQASVFESGLLTSNITIENNFSHLTPSTDAPYNSLVAYYPFDVNTSTYTYDYSSNNKDGTITNITFNNSCVYGGCYDFPVGTFGNSRIATTSDLIGTGADSFCAWINTRNHQNGRITDNGNFLIIDVETENVLRFSSDGTTNSLDTPLTLNKWTHFCAVRNSTGYGWLYVNGTLINSGATGTPIAGTTNVIIGNRNALARNFNGQIDEVMIFNTSLNSSQILDIYNNQSQRFKSQGTQTLKQVNITTGNNKIISSISNYQTLFGSSISQRFGEWNINYGYNNSDLNGMNGLVYYYHLDEENWDGTLGEVKDSISGINLTARAAILNAPNTTSRAQYYRSGAFLGNDTYLNSTSTVSINTSKPITMSTWIRLNGTRNLPACYGAGIVNIKSPAFSYTTAMAVGLQMSNPASCSGAQTYPRFRIAGTGTNLAITSKPVTVGQWAHIVGTFNGTNCSIYMDGVLEQTVDCIGGTTYNYPIFIGVSPYELDSAMKYSFFDGDIDEVMIFNRSLSVSEIQELYTKGRANWNYTDYQNLTSPTINNSFDISNLTTNILLEFKLIAGTNLFYTPNLLATLGLTLNISNVTTGNVTGNPINYPTFLNNLTSNNEYAPNKDYYLNITILNTNGTTGIEFNGVNYSLLNVSTSFYNITNNLAVGSYNYYFWAYNHNTTDNYFNNSENYTFNVIQNSSYDMTIYGSSPLIYLAPAGISNSSCPSQIECILYRNDTGEITSPDNEVLGVGFYNYTFNSSGNVNYTSKSTSFILEVIQNSDNCNMLFNDTNPITYPKIFTAFSNCGSSFKLYRNGTLIANNSNQEGLSVGVYNYSVFRDDTQNYSNILEQINLTILPNNSSCRVLFNTTSPLTYPNNQFYVYSNCDTDFRLFGNNTVIPNNTLYNYPAGTYNFTVIRNDTENYTNYYNESDFTINKGNPASLMSVSVTSPIFYETTSDASASETNIGDADLVYTLSPSNRIFGVVESPVSFSYYTAGGENWTSGNVSTTMVVNKKAPVLGFTVSPTWSVLEGTETTVTGVNCPSQLNASGLCNLFRQNQLVSNPDVQTLPLGTYTYIYNTTGNANYTDYTISSPLLISGQSFVGGTCPAGYYVSGLSNATVQCTKITPVCRYKKFGYYNEQIPFFGRDRCI